MLHDQRVKRLPVVSDDRTLIGIVARSDVLSVYSRADTEMSFVRGRLSYPAEPPYRSSALF